MLNVVVLQTFFAVRGKNLQKVIEHAEEHKKINPALADELRFIANGTSDLVSKNTVYSLREREYFRVCSWIAPHLLRNLAQTPACAS